MDFWFKPWIQIGANLPKVNASPVKQPVSNTSNRPAGIPQEPMMSYNVQGTILPWISDDRANKLINIVNKLAKSDTEKKILMQEGYQKAIEMDQADAYNKDRESMKQEMTLRAAKSQDPQEKSKLQNTVKLSNFADMIREWAKKKGIQVPTNMKDEALVNGYLQNNPNRWTDFEDYMNGKVDWLGLGKKLGIIEEEVEEDNTAKSILDFFSGKPISTEREINDLLHPLSGNFDPSEALNLGGKTILNLVPNTISMIKWLSNIVFHPKQTVEWIKTIWEGIIDQAKGISDTPQAQMVSGIWNDIKWTVTNPQKLGQFLAENPLDVLTAVSPKSAWALWEVALKATGKWIARWSEVIWKWTARASEFVASQAFGITPQTIKTIIKNPELYSKVEQSVVNSENLLGSLGTKIDEKIAKIWETGKWYQAIKETANIQSPIEEINNALSKRGITIKDWKLDFTNTNMADASDMNAIQKAYDFVNAKDVNVLNTRGKIDDLINYESKTTSKWQSVVKEIRNIIDNKGKSEIPWLAKLDATYWSEVKELKNIKKDFLNADWTFKDNALSRISNLTKKGNEAKLERVKNLIPWIEEHINAIRAFEDVSLAWGQKVGAYLRGAGTVGIWAITWWPVGAVVWLLLTSPQVATNLLKWLGYTKKFINNIVNKLKTGTKITQQEMSILSSKIENGNTSTIIDNNPNVINK